MAEIRVEGATVTLVGEIDMENAGDLMAAIAELVDAGARHITFDVSALAFIDSAGIGAICVLLRDAIGFTFIGAAGSVRRTLQFAGLIDKETT